MGKNTFFLIKQLAITDFKLRYNGSVLGYLWSLLNPLLMFGVLYLVFSVFMRFGNIENYQLYLLLGIMLWGYFSEATSNGMSAIMYKSSLISKIYFPKWIIIVASNLTSILTLILNLIVFIIFYIISGTTLTITGWAFILIVIQLVLLSFGVSLFLSAFYLKFRDLQHLWSVAIQIGFWLTPIIYPLSQIPEKYRQLLFINPMARIIEDSRNVLIYGGLPTLKHSLITFGMVFFFLILGWIVFNKRCDKFAEEL